MYVTDDAAIQEEKAGRTSKPMVCVVHSGAVSYCMRALATRNNYNYCITHLIDVNLPADVECCPCSVWKHKNACCVNVVLHIPINPVPKHQIAYVPNQIAPHIFCKAQCNVGAHVAVRPGDDGVICVNGGTRRR